jgi:diguanylate cyclase (GGDEF)-like protein
MADALADDPQALLHQALKTLARDERELTPRERLAAALGLAAAGDLLDQVSHTKRGLQVGLPLAVLLKDDDAQCLLRLEAARVAGFDGSEQAAVAPLKNALALAEAARKGWCAAATRQALGRVYGHIGRHAEGTAELLEANRLYQQQGDTAGSAGVLSDLAWLYRGQPDSPQALPRAVQAGEAALALLQPARQRHLAATVNHTLASLYESAGQYELARTHAQAALRSAAETGDLAGTGYIGHLASRIEMKTGNAARALVLVEKAKQAFGEAGVRLMVLQAGVLRAQALLALGRQAEAAQELDAMEALRRQHDEPSVDGTPGRSPGGIRASLGVAGRSARLDIAAYDADYHGTRLALYESLGDFESALRAGKALAAAERRRMTEDNRRMAAELQERFEAQRREAENTLLREQQRASASRNTFLVVTLLVSLACAGILVAYLVQLRLQRRRLVELAARDDLTGLPNRRSIMELARRARQGMPGMREPLCVAVMDIDHFKQVNDTHGHEVGDRALQTFARVCKRRLRGRDMIGRLGGEEFLLVLPGARREDLPAVFTRLQAGLQAARIPGMPADARLTFSMGCATLRPNEDIEPAIRRADEGVYRAKAQGRDRLVIAEAMV